MKIEQLPLFFSTCGALTKLNLSLQQEVIESIDLDLPNIDIDYTLVGKTYSNTPLEEPLSLRANTITYVVNICRQLSMCAIKFNRDIGAICAGLVDCEIIDLKSDVKYNR